jgi:hypothetical protein
MPAAKPTAELAPHSWDFEHWPQIVWPHSEGRARYVMRAYHDELMQAGAISRVGREIVFLGSKYTRWLERRRAEVPGFSVGAARSRSAS